MSRLHLGEHMIEHEEPKDKGVHSGDESENEECDSGGEKEDEVQLHTELPKSEKRVTRGLVKTNGKGSSKGDDKYLLTGYQSVVMQLLLNHPIHQKANPHSNSFAEFVMQS